MNNDKFIISYDGVPLAIVENVEYKRPSDVIRWYAKEYAFDLSKLTWTHITTVRMP